MDIGFSCVGFPRFYLFFVFIQVGRVAECSQYMVHAHYPAFFRRPERKEVIAEFRVTLPKIPRRKEIPMRASSTRTTVCGLLVIVSLVIAGCGGGGGSAIPFFAVQTVSGVAAAGSAMIGVVSLSDVNGHPAPGSPQRLDKNGGFAFNVFGMTPPFLLTAEGTVGGTSMTLSSVAMGTGTANINPMSNIALAAAAGVNNPAMADVSKITSASLNQAISALQDMMEPVLSQFGATGTNPVTGAYTANHAGLDAVFDVVQMPIVNTTTGAISVIDKTFGTTGATIGSATVTNLAAADKVLPVAMPWVPSDLLSMSTMLNNMVTVMNAKKIFLQPGDLDTFFAPDSNFGINGGMTRSEVMLALTDFVKIAGFSSGLSTGITNVTFNGNFPGGGYRIMFAVRFSDGSLVMSNMTVSDETVVMKNAINNAWQFTGNGFHTIFNNSMTNQQWQTATTTLGEAGLLFSMLEGISGGALPKVLKSATVTGPGLVPSPVSFVKDSTNHAFILATPNNTLPSLGSTFFTMPDATIAALPDNARYTFSFYSSLPPRNNPVETRTMTYPKPCYTRSEATGGFAGNIFPTMTPAVNNHSFQSMMTFMTGQGMREGFMTMPFTYTTPRFGIPVLAAMSSSLVITGTNTGFSDGIFLMLSLTGSSSLMPMQPPPGMPPTSGTGELDVHAIDIFGRDAVTAWMFQ